MFVHSSPEKVHGLPHYCNGLYNIFRAMEDQGLREFWLTLLPLPFPKPPYIESSFKSCLRISGEPHPKPPSSYFSPILQQPQIECQSSGAGIYMLSKSQVWAPEIHFCWLNPAQSREQLCLLQVCMGQQAHPFLHFVIQTCTSLWTLRITVILGCPYPPLLFY